LRQAQFLADHLGGFDHEVITGTQFCTVTDHAYLIPSSYAQAYCIVEINGLHDRREIVIAIGSFSQYIQRQVDFCVRRYYIERIGRRYLLYGMW